MVAFAVQGLINLRRARIAPRGFAGRLPEVLAGAVSRSQARAALGAEGHAVAAILARVLGHLELRPDADPVELLHEEIAEECEALTARNSQLALIYNVAPLCGLLGTVFGMIQTFQNYTQAAEPSIRELGQGVHLALLTTAWGLSIAIPAFVMLYSLMRRIGAYEQVVLPREGLEALHVMLDLLRARERGDGADGQA
jgi:biopolymer transport protein ExbB